MRSRVERMQGSRTQRRAGWSGRRRGFTLIELLVVIGIISLLVAMTVVVGGKVIAGQKKNLTETIMRNTMTAIEQFATEDPLRSIYGRKAWPTFGPYPPYQLEGTVSSSIPPFTSVRDALEPAHPYFTSFSDPNPRTLRDRVAYDLSGGELTGGFGQWVSDDFGDDNNDDIRALYTYLTVYAPGTLAQVPEKHIKALKDTPEYVNPTGADSPPPGAADTTWIDVFGIHDAWDEPLDYMLYVKLEWGPPPVGSAVTEPTWRVVERKPVLRSRGVDREVAAADGDRTADWIWSEPLPTPFANHQNAVFWKDGAFSLNSTSENGWARAVAKGDLQVESDDVERGRVLGYVPYP